MKVISKKEFQDAYISPTEEQSARMQAKLNSLQQEPEERRHVLRAKPRLAFIMAALLVIAVITAIAASTIKYQVSWEVESSSEQEIVVLYRSYTSAQIRYHIDRSTGETYVTEFVPGITAAEERTDESFNLWDYVG